MSPQASGVTEFLSHSTSSQPSPVSRLFSPSTVQDSLVKGEQVPLHGGSPQVPATGSSEYSPEWCRRGFVGNKTVLGWGGHSQAPISKLGLQNLPSAPSTVWGNAHWEAVATPAEKEERVAGRHVRAREPVHPGNHQSRVASTPKEPHSEDLACSSQFHPERGLNSSCPQSGKLKSGVAVAMEPAAGS